MDNNNIDGASDQIQILKVPESIVEHLRKIRENELFIAIVTDSYLKLDVQVAMELGTAIMSGRKIGLLIKKGTVVPERLILLADVVEYFEGEKDIKEQGDFLYNRLIEGIA